jgi:hypothetical protein
MNLHTVIAVSTMDKYCACIPYFIQAWNHLFPDVKIIVLLISSRLPKFLEPYASYIELIPMHRLPMHLPVETIARQLRFFYPSYYHTQSARLLQGLEDNLLVCNVDTIPCSRHSFLKALELFAEDTFVQLLDTEIPEISDRFPIKYCLGTSKLWNDIFKAQSWEDIVLHMKDMDSLVYFRELLVASSIYPTNVRIAGSGNINHQSFPFEQALTILKNNSDKDILSSYTDCVLMLPIVNYLEYVNLILKTILAS